MSANCKDVIAGGTRYSTGVRTDLLVPSYIVGMARIMCVGAQKYGEFNWQKGLSGEKGGVNHALQHLLAYQAGEPNDYGTRKMHLAQVGVNCMFEWHFEEQREEADQEAVHMASMEKAKADSLADEVAVSIRNMTQKQRNQLLKLTGLRRK